LDRAAAELGEIGDEIDEEDGIDEPGGDPRR
jgi:hypothetical protein